MGPTYMQHLAASFDDLWTQPLEFAGAEWPKGQPTYMQDLAASFDDLWTQTLEFAGAEWPKGQLTYMQHWCGMAQGATHLHATLGGIFR